MAVLIKRYANRKLYNTDTSRYITLKGIAELLERDQEVRVIDNETGEDITSITLSQILVDTERANRAIPGTLLHGLFQKGGDALYDALSKGVDDAGERIDEFQKNMRRMLRVEEQGRRRAEWIQGPKELEHLIQRVAERVFEVLDLPRRTDVDALAERIDRLTQTLEALEKKIDPQEPREP